ncbi:MAG: polysaccharide deacetylase family protein [Bacillota bacterium]|nr:polysaccharide deacetylase family protein [Bacillota bacterium]
MNKDNFNNNKKHRDSKKNKKRNEILIISVCSVILYFLSFFAGLKIFESKTNYKSSNVVNNNIQHDTKNDDSILKLSLHNNSLKTNEQDIKFAQPLANEEYKSANPELCVYLTFDDGPSKNVTPLVLDTLKKYNVKATFFVIGSMAEQSPDILKREYNEGHSIGNHTYSHDMNLVYKSTDACISEFKKNESVINNILGGYTSKLVRFPGGIFDNDSRHLSYRQAVVDAGYHYYNWNCSDQDSEGKVPVGGFAPSILIDWVKNTSVIGSTPNQRLIVLMHDAPAKKTTAEALPSIIEYFQSEGYKFKTLK